MSIHFPRPKEVKILYDPRLGTHDRPLPTVSVSSGSVIYPQGWGAKTTAPNGAQPSVGVMVNGIEISNPGTPSLDPDVNIPFVRIPHNPDIRQVVSGNEGFWYNNPCCYTVPITKALNAALKNANIIGEGKEINYKKLMGCMGMTDARHGETPIEVLPVSPTNPFDSPIKSQPIINYGSSLLQKK